MDFVLGGDQEFRERIGVDDRFVSPFSVPLPLPLLVVFAPQMITQGGLNSIDGSL